MENSSLRTIKIDKNKQYTDGAPIYLEGYVVSVDIDDSGLFLQASYRVIDDRTVTGITVDYTCLDANGEVIGCIENYQYSDLSAAKNERFGANILCPLLCSSVESVSITLKSVEFEDGSFWNNFSGLAFYPEDQPDFSAGILLKPDAAEDENYSEAVRGRERAYAQMQEFTKKRQKKRRKLLFLLIPLACILFIVFSFDEISAKYHEFMNQENMTEDESEEDTTDKQSGVVPVPGIDDLTTEEPTTEKKTTEEKTTTAEKTTAEKTTAEKTTAEKTTAGTTAAVKTGKLSDGIYSNGDFYLIIRNGTAASCTAADYSAKYYRFKYTVKEADGSYTISCSEESRSMKLTVKSDGSIKVTNISGLLERAGTYSSVD